MSIQPQIASTETALVGAREKWIIQASLTFARHVFDAPAASIFVYEPVIDQQRFEATSGIDGELLLGETMPATTGIAGLVIQTGAATIATDLSDNPRFNRDFAERSGYVPATVCAAPLMFDDDLIGVIEILDPSRERFGDLHLMGILETLADQISVSIQVLRELRAFRNSPAPVSSRRSQLSAIVASLPEKIFEDGRSTVLEAVVAQLAGSASWYAKL